MVVGSSDGFFFGRGFRIGLWVVRFSVGVWILVVDGGRSGRKVVFFCESSVVFIM